MNIPKFANPLIARKYYQYIFNISTSFTKMKNTYYSIPSIPYVVRNRVVLKTLPHQS